MKTKILKGVFLFVIIYASLGTLNSQSLIIKKADPGGRVLKKYKIEDFTNFQVNEIYFLTGNISKFEDSTLSICDYSKELMENYSDLDGNFYSYYLDESEKKIEIKDIQAVYEYKSLKNYGHAAKLLSVLCFILAPAVSLDYKDFNSFNQKRYMTTNLVGLGLLTTGITISVCFQNRVFVNADNEPADLRYGGKGKRVKLEIQP